MALAAGQVRSYRNSPADGEAFAKALRVGQVFAMHMVIENVARSQDG